MFTQFQEYLRAERGYKIQSYIGLYFMGMFHIKLYTALYNLWCQTMYLN
jgi:hypothetical protein